MQILLGLGTIMHARWICGISKHIGRTSIFFIAELSPGTLPMVQEKKFFKK